jgi:hypothetical protein
MSIYIAGISFSSSFCLIIIITVVLFIKYKREKDTSVKIESESHSTTINAKVDSKLLQIDCTVNGNVYKCSNPQNLDKNITITDGPIFKISNSVEIDNFNKSTTDYYIIVPFVFIVDYIVSISTKEIVINSLNDFTKSLDDVERNYNNTNTIPGKCLNIPLKIRTESKAPYNTTCIFFDNGFGKISALSNIIEKSLLPALPDNVLNDYFNLTSNKINTISILTIFEYVMYLALLNKVKNKNNKYLTLCTSDDFNIVC